ncbi:nucleolar protein viriato isoform 1-T3 [Cochliomyia hominivorax]
MTRKKAPKQKLEIIFDPKKRREFLTGFTKRKNERRKRAKEELERSLKEERKRIRQEIKEGVKHMKKTFEPLKELTEADKAEEDEYEDDDVKVKIVELTTGELAAQRNMLGENHGDEDAEESEPDQDTDDEEDNANCIPGMDFDVNAKRKRKSATAETECENEEDTDNNGNKKSSQKKPKFSFEDVRSKKELDHLKKTKTLKQLKKSKVFKMKEHLDKKVNQKKARKDRNNTLRSIPKHLRKKKKFEKNPYSKGRKLNKKQLKKKYEK